MNSAVAAAVITAIVALIGVIASLAVALRNLAQQRDSLNKTLKEQHLRTLNERFATAADKLGSDKQAVRIAGVYAMAVLADDWKEDKEAQQAYIGVLCAYLRMPYEPDPGPLAPAEKQREFQSSREVRHTVIRVITEHLRDPQIRSDRKVAGVTKRAAKVPWRGQNFNFHRVVFDGGTFSDSCFSAGGKVEFSDAEFSGKVSFHHANFSGGKVDFHRVKFSGGTVEFHDAKFYGSAVGFDDAEFSGCEVDFDRAEFSGGEVSFPRARFSGGTVDFSKATNWSHPPKFDWEGAPPVGVELPAAASGESQ